MADSDILITILLLENFELLEILHVIIDNLLDLLREPVQVLKNACGNERSDQLKRVFDILNGLFIVGIDNVSDTVSSRPLLFCVARGRYRVGGSLRCHNR